ncbi:unnamed protein product [Echinostoma caproni]|uniref:EIF2A domain-containing protein n=1 Tax=Echinostoma caproni TaxID=27848 RepID=A0A183B507_9TREM|nr:unnamed protein product [Echinostoma caproni]
MFDSGFSSALLLLAGLGSLTGDMCVWNFRQYEKLSTFKTSDVTAVSWFNDGEHLLLSTTTPRLRVNNGFGVWHYGGKRLLFEKVAPRAVPRPATFDLPAATEHELYEVQVVPQHPLPPAPKPKKFDQVRVRWAPVVRRLRLLVKSDFFLFATCNAFFPD